MAVLGMAAALFGVAGCTGVLGIDQDYEAADGGGGLGGAGGAGGSTASSGGSGGMGGLGGAGGQGGRPQACPMGAPGPDMVAMGSFCIDATEVTNADYAAFVTADPANMVNGCNNNDITPTANWPPAAGDEQLPVVFVDWCDAANFCLWAGKSLCGASNGNATPFNQFADPGISLWHNACTQGGAEDYPYGAYLAGHCVDDVYDGVPGFDMSTDLVQPVGSAMDCRGAAAPFDQVFDLSGNVREWEDACQGNSCRLRGGSFQEAAGGVSCAADDSVNDATTAGDIGFRCCTTG